MYLFAFVPEYKEVRTFGVPRIRAVSLHEERFTPAELPDTIFAHSLGVHEGPPERIEIEFDAGIAPYISERTWHPSQSIAARKDGGAVLSLDVSNDWALRSWILSFGPLARVLSPAHLAAQIKGEIDRAAARYADA
jgi:predicted DNA-binding transcriptional regulator YafY